MEKSDEWNRTAEHAIEGFLGNRSLRRKAFVWIVSVATVCFLVYLGARYIGPIATALSYVVDLFLPLLMGVFFALVLDLPLGFIEPRLFRGNPASKAKRPLAIVLSLLLVFGVLALVLVLVVPEFIRAVIALGREAASVLSALAVSSVNIDWSTIPFGSYFSQLNINWDRAQGPLEDLAAQIASSLDEGLSSTIKSTSGFVANSFIGLVFSIYILQSKERISAQANRLLDAWVPESASKMLRRVMSVCGNAFKQFAAGQATEAIILGVLCTVGMFVLQLPYAAMIGALVCVTALIPYIGALIGGVLGAVLIITIDPFKAFVFVVFFLILQQVEGNLIYPKVMGARINLPSIWVFAAVVVGGKVAGPLGMLLGIPIASSVYELMDEFTQARELGKARKASGGV